MLALLLGTVSLFAAAPAQAQTTVVWSATLTVKELGGPSVIGCNATTAGSLCTTLLTDNSFTYGGVDYTVEFTTNVPTITRININLDKAIPQALTSFRVGSTDLALSSATLSNSNKTATWTNTGLSWTVNQQVSLSLVGPPPPPPTVSLSVDPNRSVTEGSDFYVTAWLSEPLAETVRIPLKLTNHTAEPDDYEYKHIHNGYITIVAGQRSHQQWFQTNQDDDTDDETFTVAVDTAKLPSSVTAGGTTSVSIRINDDDGSGDLNVRLWVSPNPVPEGSPVTVRVTLYRGSSESVAPWNVPVPLWVRRVTSEEGDHDETLESITIPRGHTSASAEIWTSRDSDADNEEFTVEMTEPRGGQALLGSPSRARVTISENRGGTGSGGGGGGGLPSGGGGGGGGPSPPTGGGEPPPGSDEEPSTSCPEEDREILRSFYEMTGGENWDESEYWNSDEPLGEWHGVETDEDGEVVSLRLPDNGLSGNMPTRELRCLTELVELALWGNDGLTGEVPDELTLAVERAALRYLAETLDVNPGWFENYEDPYDFENWHEGVTIDDDGRVTELDLTGERVTGEIPENIHELLPRLGRIMVTRSSEDGGCALSPEDGSSAFGLFLLTLFVFAALRRKRARG